MAPLFASTAFIRQKASACLARQKHACVGGELGPWYSKGNTGMLSRYCVNIGLQTFPTFWEHLYAGAIKTIHISNRRLRNSAVQSGKTFVPRFTLSRDKPYVVVTKRCQNTPICECLFTFDFSKQWPHSLRIVISLGGDLAWLPSTAERYFRRDPYKKSRTKFGQNATSAFAKEKIANHRFASVLVGSWKSRKKPACSYFF